MGLFDFIKNSERQKNSNIDIAEELFDSLSMSTRIGTEKVKRQIEAILKQCPTRQDILNKVIELCGEPVTPRQRLLLAKVYASSSVEFRKLAIVNIEEYLNNPIYEDEYINRHHSYADKTFSVNEEKNIHISEMHCMLGKAYEGEYEFDKALTCYRKEQELTPFWPASYCHICSIFMKQNKLNEAMEVYLAAKRSPYYKPIKFKTVLGDSYTEDTFKKVIDSHIIELQEKIDKGYVYKPRKNKGKT